MKAHKISSRVYADTSGEGRGNIGAIELPNYTIVIDSTLFPQTAATFRASLNSQTKSPIHKLILTHCHEDHIFGNQVFEDCEIISNKTLKKRMEELAPEEWTKKKLIEWEKEVPEYAGKLRNVRITYPTVTFEETLTLKDEDYSVKIVHSGGHSGDTSYIYLPQEKTLFSGDLIFAKSFFWGGDPTFNPEKWISALRNFLNMKIDTIVPGHGSLCDKEEVKIYLEFFQKTSSIMKELVQKELQEKEIVKHKEFPDFYSPYREGVRERALVNWYNFYKRKAET